MPKRVGSLVQGFLHSLQNDGELSPALALLAEALSLSAVGFEPPCWLDLLAGQAAPPVPEGELHFDTSRKTLWLHWGQDSPFKRKSKCTTKYTNKCTRILRNCCESFHVLWVGFCRLLWEDAVAPGHRC